VSDPTFVDTNVLVYAIETIGADLPKAEKARQILRQSELHISTQVLGEFYRVATSSRRTSRLNHEDACNYLFGWRSRCRVHPVTEAHVDEALELVGRYGVSYYDALILAAAKIARCAVVLSEDLNAGQSYGGVRVLNPFA
jgi:predicted nucleic acid-binding protein